LSREVNPVMKLCIVIEADLSIAEKGCNVNEMAMAIDNFLEEARSALLKKVMQEYQEQVVKKVVEGCAPAEWVEHPPKGILTGRCASNSYVLKGWRREPRNVLTEISGVEFWVRQVQCKRCGKVFGPVLRALGIKGMQRKSEGLRRILAELCTQMSYRSSTGVLEKLKKIRVPKSTAHRWVMEKGWEPGFEIQEQPQVLMADGTGYHSRSKSRGEIRAVVGLDEKGRLKPLGVWANTSWKRIGNEVKKLIKGNAKALVADGESGISEAIGEYAQAEQRCLWHGIRDLHYALWGDGLSKAEREPHVARFTALVGLELPKEEYEMVNEETKGIIRAKLEEQKAGIKGLVLELRAKGYHKAAEYIGNCADQLFSRVELWLEIGFVSPKTTGILERLIGSLGRRIKHIGARWSDIGIERISRLLLKKIYTQAEWERYWRERLGLRGNCSILLRNISLVPVMS